MSLRVSPCIQTCSVRGPAGAAADDDAADDAGGAESADDATDELSDDDAAPAVEPASDELVSGELVLDDAPPTVVLEPHAPAPRTATAVRAIAAVNLGRTALMSISLSPTGRGIAPDWLGKFPYLIRDGQSGQGISETNFPGAPTGIDRPSGQPSNSAPACAVLPMACSSSQTARARSTQSTTRSPGLACAIPARVDSISSRTTLMSLTRAPSR